MLEDIARDIYIEALKKNHASLMFNGLSDPGLYVFIDEEPPVSIKELEKIYCYRSKQLSPDGNYIWLNWIIRHPSFDTGLGFVQATIDIKSKSTYIGYLVFTEFSGKGVATCSVEKMLNILESSWGVKNIFAMVDRKNIASISLLKKLNFSINCDGIADNQDVELFLKL